MMQRKAKRFLTRVLVIAILAILARWVGNPESLAATSNIKVIDGDSLLLDGMKVRLLGIDAPESGQICQDHTGQNYGCGQRATKHLRYLIDTHQVSCKLTEKDQYGRGLVLCDAGSIMLNQQMVHDGWAVPFRNEYVDYRRDAKAAEQSKRGLWHGTFMLPRDWKKQHPRY